MATFEWDGILYELIFVCWIFSHLKITNFLSQQQRKNKGSFAHSYTSGFFVPFNFSSFSSLFYHPKLILRRNRKNAELDELHSSSEHFKFIYFENAINLVDDGDNDDDDDLQFSFTGDPFSHWSNACH